MSHIWSNITSVLLAITSIFMILIILLQRGRGGGLAGAFGASGGQSAFGTKAGDKFTIITIVTAVIWVALAGVTTFAMRSEQQESRFVPSPQEGAIESVPAEPKGEKQGANVFGEEKKTESAPAKTGTPEKTGKSLDTSKIAPSAEGKAKKGEGQPAGTQKSESAGKSTSTSPPPATKTPDGTAAPTPSSDAGKASNTKTGTSPASSK